MSALIPVLQSPAGTIAFVIFIAVNGLSFLLFAADKRKSQAGAWRIPETTLLCSAVIGPFGAFLAMQVFRHKIRHLKFFVVPLFCIVQILAFFWLFTGSF